MKTRFYPIAVAALILAACNREEPEVDPTGNIDVPAMTNPAPIPLPDTTDLEMDTVGRRVNPDTLQTNTSS